MVIKYFCDICDNEVARKALLSRIMISEIDLEDAHSFNLSNIEEYRLSISKDICIYCRIRLIGNINTLGSQK